MVGGGGAKQCESKVRRKFWGDHAHFYQLRAGRVVLNLLLNCQWFLDHALRAVNRTNLIATPYCLIHLHNRVNISRKYSCVSKKQSSCCHQRSSHFSNEKSSSVVILSVKVGWRLIQIRCTLWVQCTWPSLMPWRWDTFLVYVHTIQVFCC